MRGISFLLNLNSSIYRGSMRVGSNLQVSAKLLDPLAHPHDSDTRPPAIGAFWNRETTSLIHDPHADCSFFFREPNDGALASGMPVHIRQTFLHDSEQCRFNVRVHAADFLRCHKFNLNTASQAESSHKCLQCWDKAHFIKERRMEHIRQGSKIVNGSI